VQHPYLNSGLPPPSTQMQYNSVTPNQYNVPPPIDNPPFQNLQPSLPNYPPLNMNGAPSFKQGQYPSSQPPYNGPPGNQPPPMTGYPPQPQYSNMAGPSAMPNNQLNGPNSYSGQPPTSGPLSPQQPFAQSRIDPDVIPNVVRIYFFLK
jgi:hypothetical protein